MKRSDRPNPPSENPKHPSGQRPKGVVVLEVEEASPAARAGIEAGERILSINGSPVRDEIDLVFFSAESDLEIRCIARDRTARDIAIRKSPDEPLGIRIEPIGPRNCRNKCVFCFVDQNPPNLRPQLYFKDEDFRLSFTHGHYITTTGLRHADLERIAEQRLSPLYLSIHATRHDLRCRMLGVDPQKTPDILETIRFFADRRIQFHAQIVLCPSWNDGAELDRSLDDLEGFLPALLSVAIVPVGLTAHREGLPEITPVTPSLAVSVLDRIAPRQKRLRRKYGERIVLAADEFYLLAGREPPAYSRAEIECQIENGVGMIAEFREGWPAFSRKLPSRVAAPRKVLLLTGLLGARVLEPVADRLGRIEGLEILVVAIENMLFGRSVTVSGLLSGADFDRALAEHPDADLALLPANALRPDDARFLDDLLLDELRRRHPRARIEPVERRAVEIARVALEGS